jgi:hypothetical protein
LKLWTWPIRSLKDRRRWLFDDLTPFRVRLVAAGLVEPEVTEKRNKKRRKILLDAARPVMAYLARRHRG